MKTLGSRRMPFMLANITKGQNMY